MAKEHGDLIESREAQQKEVQRMEDRRVAMDGTSSHF